MIEKDKPHLLHKNTHLIASSPQLACGEDAGRKPRVKTILSIFSTAPTNTTIPYILITTMLIMSLACLQTAMVAQSEPTSAPSAASTPPRYESAYGAEIESGAVFEIVEQPAKTCATVTAIQSLNLREQPSEKSTAISWLPARTIVVVVGRVGDWWKIESALGDGYARAKYLQESECE